MIFTRMSISPRTWISISFTAISCRFVGWNTDICFSESGYICSKHLVGNIFPVSALTWSMTFWVMWEGCTSSFAIIRCRSCWCFLAFEMDFGATKTFFFQDHNSDIAVIFSRFSTSFLQSCLIDYILTQTRETLLNISRIDRTF